MRCNMAGMMKKVQDMQARLETLQAEFDTQHFFKRKGNDYVTATVTEVEPCMPSKLTQA